jgi:hypothetical protein
MKGTLNYNGETREIDIPTKWLDVKFRHFAPLVEAGVLTPNTEIDWLKVFSVFTGLTTEELESVTWANLDALLIGLTFLHSPLPTDIPKTVLGYTIPEDIGFETVGQYKYLREDVQNSADMTPIEQLSRYPLYVAVYACAQKHGEFSWQKCEAMADEFLDAPAPEVLATANFTLLKLIGLSKHIEPGSPQQPTRLKRMKRAMLAWVLYSVSTAQLWLWKRKPA